MNRTEMTLLQRAELELLWLWAWLFAVMPYWFKYYVVENLLYFLLCYVLRYRRKVVRRNLRNSFPEKSERELAEICRRFYRTLAELFVDTINMAHMSADKARTVLTVKGLEEHRAAVKGRDWIALTAHYGCWEYCSYWGLYEPSQMLVAVYHPLRSVVMERFYQRLRNYENSTTVAMKECLRFYLRNRETGIDGKNLVMGLIADQNPPRRPDSHWFRFLNQDTIFFDGGEKLALRCHLPVYFVRMERLQRGRYQMSFELLYDGEEEVAPNEITERYVRRLEAVIVERPELWIWSHRRWKHKRKNANG
ncbi:MAG TPA: lysophospholipid acyltransferase family protein [Candidatus Alistipes stercorigallinarum]|nr:lysophospholipid acyltransferase family protein [uncultured Alistipes sp.]HJC16749.1 lysophospholipid acyltransferase family protein [Candidatus Alistipes stercorigallinarum]